MIGSSVRRWLMEHAALEPALLEGVGFDSIVAERIAAAGGDSAYVALLARSSDEVDRLIASIAVPETWLFRYPRAYDLLVEFLERRLAASSGANALRMLSVGCATGQEPYCMAMAALHAGWQAERVSVEGLDRSAESLRIAAVGEYGANSIRTEIPAWAVSFLRRAGGDVGVDPRLREVVRFTCADVTQPSTWQRTSPYDVIFCRNVLIYLNAAARAKLLESICAALAPAGLLFVGHAEQNVSGGVPLRAVPAPHAFALARSDGAPADLIDRRALDRAPGRARTTAPRAAAPTVPPATAPAARSASRNDREPSPDVSLDGARDLADAGRMQDAEAMIRAVIARESPSAEALELLGMIRMAANDTPGARRLFEQAVYLEPTRSASLLQLAMISEHSGDAPRARLLWDRASRASAPRPREPRR